MSQAVPASMQAAFERTEHPFHMWEGLVSTPEALAAVLEPAVQEQILAAARAALSAEQVHLVGCGTSYFSAIAGTYAVHAIADVPSQAHNAFEFTAYPPAGLARSAVVAISHTGTTPVVLDAVKLAADRGAVTVGLTDMQESPLATVPAHAILGGGGREPSLPKTKSYPASLLRHYLLAAQIGELKGKDVSGLKASLREAPANARAILDASLPLTRQLAAERRPEAGVYLFGCGPNVATVMEGVLKLQESAQIKAHGWELEEGMHGPWGIMEPGDLVILLAMRGPGLEKARGLSEALRHLGVQIWAITDDPSAVPGAAYVTRTPADVPEYFSTLYTVLPLYQFTYFTALALGKRPDCMRLTDPRYLQTRLSLPR